MSIKLNELDSKIKILASDIYERLKSDKSKNQDTSFTLFLGAGASVSSKCPSWDTLCREYFKDKHQIIKENQDPNSLFQEEMGKLGENKRYIYNLFAKQLEKKEPSVGYYHIANLIKKGVFKTIITTNFDNLLELAMSRIIPISDFKVLIRQELDDNYIVDFIKKGNYKTNIIKLHGDLQSNTFMFKENELSTFKNGSNLVNCLKDKIDNDCIIVGSAIYDADVKELFEKSDKYKVFVNIKDPSIEIINSLKLESLNQIIIKNNTQKTNQDDDLENEDDCFDYFFELLDIELNRLEVEKNITYKQRLNKIQNTILTKQGKGAGYINDSQIKNSISDYWEIIKKSYKSNKQYYPDVIIFIYDPSAPGGIELMKRFSEKINEPDPFKRINYSGKIDSVDIQGDEIGRYIDREVRSNKDHFDYIEKDELKNVLILDAISFTGNTLDRVVKKFNEWFPDSDCNFKCGAMYIGERLYEKDNYKYIVLETVDRHEIFFPWGLSQSTAECKRKLLGYDDDNNHTIRITKKPWGAIERFTEFENSSVRILTVEADQRLSFQRHLVRDEFFVALDENVGLEICGESLIEYTNDSSEKNRIKNEIGVKSLILEKGDYVLIPRGIWHRIKASKERVRLLEIAYGVYDEKSDIKRLLDDYGRENKNGLK